jgi:hypothetical protein
MAWTESFHCDVCNKEKSEEAEDWWLAWTESLTPPAGDPEQRMVRVAPWNSFLAHASDVRHLCGARCVHTLMDRWMTAKPAAPATRAGTH